MLGQVGIYCDMFGNGWLDLSCFHVLWMLGILPVDSDNWHYNMSYTLW
jgi:hypothetical protein